MLTSKIKITNFKTKKQKKYYIYKEIKKINFLKKYKFLISLTNNYKNNYKNLKLKKLKKIKNINLIGMGGSILGSKAIYSFLRNKIKKNFQFIDNLNASEKSKININKNINIIISKSGNTLETISNFSLIKKKQKNIFITERTNNHLYNLAMQTKSEIVEHKNYIGGRYSVLSEVGMLPAELMGLNVSKFKQFNNLIKNKRFILNLITNTLEAFARSRKKISRVISIRAKLEDSKLSFIYSDNAGGMTEETSPNVVQRQDTGDYANVEENPQMNVRAQQLTAKATQNMKGALTGEFNKLAGSVRVGEAAEANAKNKAQTDLREKIGMMLYANNAGTETFKLADPGYAQMVHMHAAQQRLMASGINPQTPNPLNM